MTTFRRVGVTRYDASCDTEIVITRVLNAARTIVFAAWTNPKHVPEWLLGPEGWTMPVCEIDLRPGGHWRYVWRNGGGGEMSMAGTYQEVSPPDRLVWTERWGPEWPETGNNLELVESGGVTTVSLTVSYPNRESRDAVMRTGMKDGMDQGFARLDTLLARLA